MAVDDEGDLPKTSWFLCMSDEVGTLTLQDSKAVSFNDFEGRGRVCSGDVSPSGHVTLEIIGPTPKGEEGSFDTCKRLFQHLNSLGRGVTNLREVTNKKHVDATVRAPDGSTVNIQVVRAVSDPDFWKALAKSDGRIESTLPLLEAAEKLKESIEHKDKPELAGFILALDATDLPALTLDAVRETFNGQHREWVDARGISQVWIVGMWPELIYQLGGL